ncbi:MAG: UDP-2,4-diacetamido-2,4,6-trideoxy-beta-L-altropyranose hydrolase [Gammaproteobacteria bacterium]|nr:MAG: UDP-2,4-diacetamido-2,4,6-trideoxy-beta-L-altropyranose hydrolase [Gammaproteobacteria bacterium]
MNFAFRTDASIEIGTGHVMRCMTLARALREKGASCFFICSEHPGNLIDKIRDDGFDVYALPVLQNFTLYTPKQLNHDSKYTEWLGRTWEADANKTLEILEKKDADWAVIDHYALDYRWERIIHENGHYIAAIDDLADRRHECNLLIDQNLGRNDKDYSSLVPDGCNILTGPMHAMLRPEFSSIRPYSIERRTNPLTKKILITLGGVDKDNITSHVLKALSECLLPEQMKIQVVMGPHSPWKEEVQRAADELPWKTELLVNVSNMADLMAEADLAIGAAGVTAWERCCLGLPALNIVLADNQKNNALALEDAGAALSIQRVEKITSELPEKISQLLDKKKLVAMQQACLNVTDGNGIQRLVNSIMCSNGK